MPVTLQFNYPATGLPQQGIESIAVAGATVTVTGWYDMFAKWVATVELTDEQRVQLREGLS